MQVPFNLVGWHSMTANRGDIMEKEELKNELYELEDFFVDVLKQGRASRAGSIYENILEKRRELSQYNKDKPTPEPKDKGGVKNKDSVDDFNAIKGVGKELARELQEDFGTLENLKNTSKEDLTPISGIAEKKAENLLKEVNK